MNGSTTRRFLIVFAITLLAFLAASAISYFVCSDSLKISDGFRCCGFPYIFWSQGGFDGKTRFSPGALCANIAVALFCFALASFLRNRSASWPSIVLIVSFGVAGLFLNSRFRGAWFDGGYGFPLLWYRQLDFDSPDTGFRLGGFLVDALVVLAMFGGAAYFLKRNRHQPSPPTATPI